jgi:GntR family transcriptional regulator
MVLRIEPNSSIPIFQQIVSEIERLILVGDMKDGEFIPSVRDLSLKLTINPNTVSKAFQVLQALGLVESIRGKGLRVVRQSESVLKKRRTEIFASKVRELVKEGCALGFSIKEIREQLDLQSERRGSHE